MEHETSFQRCSEKAENGIKILRRDIKVPTKKKTRRGMRNRAKSFKKELRFLGVNSAGLRPKMFTFKNILSELKPSVFVLKRRSIRMKGK